MKNRDNGLDLLRIICMLLVVAHHFYGHGGLICSQYPPPGTFNWFLGNLIYPFTQVAVNCFVLLSGYFQCTSKFKRKRVMSLWASVAVYSVSLFVVMKLLLGGFSITGLIESALPVVTDQYWFVTAYVLMYAVSPFLNIMISAMDKRMHRLCCATLLGIFCVASNLAYTYDFADINGGYTFLWFCILYIVAAYIRLHVPVEKHHRKRGLLIYVGCALGVGISRFAAHYVTTAVFGTPMLTSFFYSYNSILVTPAAIALFMAMRTVNISGKAGKVVSFFAPLAFGVYLIHDHPSIRPMLWSILKPYAFASSPWLVPYSLFCVVGVFLGCCAVEWIRQKIFILLGINKLCDRVANKIQNKWT